MLKLKLNSKLKLNHENMWIVLQFVYYHRFKLSNVTCKGVRLQLRLGYKIQTHDVNLQSALSLSNIILILHFPLKIDEMLALLSLLSTLVSLSTVNLLVRYSWSHNSVEILDALGKLVYLVH